METTDFLVIGAGMSGLTCAQALSEEHSVIVVEKARGSGGRLSSKRLNADNQQFSFDLGCTHFEASTEAFQLKLADWATKGIVTPFDIGDAMYLGSPRNSSVTRAMADQMDVRFSTRITRIERVQDRWQAYTQTDGEEHLLISARQIVFSSPPQQTMDLLPANHPLQHTLADYKILPQWVLLLVFQSKQTTTFSHPTDNTIKSISLECGKRKKQLDNNLYTLQVQATEAWSEQHIDDGIENITSILTNSVQELANRPLNIVATHLHRWLYSLPSPNNPTNAQGYLTSHDGIAVCGDYLGSGFSGLGVEAAYLSGAKLAEQLITLNRVASDVA